MKTRFLLKMAARVLLIVAAMAVGQSEVKASNWTVYGSNSATTLYILVNRDHQDYDETIYYRVVGLSAIDGQHFTAVSGSMTIQKDKYNCSFEVPLINPSDNSYKYQVGTTRSLRVEILDRAGFILATYNWSKTSGTDVNTFTHLFDDQSVTVNSDYITVRDANYEQAYHAVPVANYFSATAPQSYLCSIGAELRMTLTFTASEEDDGYQHLQILVNHPEQTGVINWDEGAGDNNPGDMNYSSYMATFCHEDGHKNTNDANYSFPVTSVGNMTFDKDHPLYAWTSLGNQIGDLHNQQFNTNCRASDGRLVISTPADLSSFSTVGIRFDATGSRNDTWYAHNTVAHIQALDQTIPSVQGDIVLSPGRHAKGNVAYISSPFSEPVNIVGASNLKLITSWGDFKYEAGAGSNVLTFKGTITANSGTELSVSSMNDQSGSTASIYLTDLAGNKAYINTNVSKTFSGVKVDADLTYTLDDFEQDSDGNYLISTIADLRGLVSYVNAGNDATGLTFRQTNNIASIGTLAPIGVSADKPFNGTYDGGGFSLSGITINGNSANSANNNSCVGLFGVTGANAVVKNVWLRSSTIKGYKYVGGIVGYNYGVIRNCLVESSVTVAYYGTTYSSDAHGGIAGYCQKNSSIEGCCSAAKLTMSSTIGGQYYGGIVGITYDIVKDCLYTGGTFGTNYGNDSYGTITGRTDAPSSQSQFLFNNYYTTDNYKAVGWTSDDVDGARKARTLTLGEGLSIDGDVTTYDVSGITAYGNVAIGYDNKVYSGATQTLTLNYSGEVPEGNDLVLTVTDADHNDITATALNGLVLTMPDADVTVTASVVPHEPGEPIYSWYELDEQIQCQAKVFCTHCGAFLDYDNATVTSEVTLEPTCEDFGQITYTATFSKPGYETQTEVFDNIPPVGHTWGDPTYAWEEDQTVPSDYHLAYCTASRECSVCHATESENGSVTWLYYHNRNDRTCTEGSGNGYEATFTNDAFTTQTWCSDLGPLGHDWNIPDANWDYMPCSRHITCKRCDFERTVYATMTYDVITAPTCTMSGEYLYHATFDFPTDNLPYPDVNVESRYYQIPCLGHEYDTDPAWSWDRDYLTATAIFTCSRCAETADADANVTHVVQGEGTTHTAQVTFNDEDYSDEQYTKYYLILDEAATNNWEICNNYDIDNMGVVRDVLILRTLYKDDNWNTLCLPFDVENIDNSPLQGAIVKTLDRNNTVMRGTHVHLAFTPVTSLEAGVPYIIKWNYDGDLVNPRFTNITDFVEPTVIYSSDAGSLMNGYYDAFPVRANENLYYLTSDNTLKYTTKDRTLKGFRAYFYFWENHNSVKPLSFDIDFGDGEATGIETLDGEPLTINHDEVYDLQGRRVSTPAKGMYIVNGKKVFIK